MPIFEIKDDGLDQIPLTTFHEAGVRERDDIQRLLKNQIQVIDPNLLVIAEEFSEWEESRRRIDLLAIDKDANIVVIELKRTEDGGFMDLQAIRYAAMVSTMTFGKIVEIFANYLRIEGKEDESESTLLEFLDWDEPQEDEFGQDVRLLLVSANFSKELTTSVMWLNTRDIDIRCVRIVPYDDGGRTLVDIQQLIPLPGAEEYQIQIREKQRQERVKRTRNQELSRQFSKELYERAKSESVHADRLRFQKQGGHWFSSGVSGVYFIYVAGMKAARVEMYIDRNDDERNLATFEKIHDHRTEVEKSFGGPLSWEPLESKRACRICFRFEALGYGSPADQWESIHSNMIDAMERLERALTPFLQEVSDI